MLNKQTFSLFYLINISTISSLLYTKNPFKSSAYSFGGLSLLPIIIKIQKILKRKIMLSPSSTSWGSNLGFFFFAFLLKLNFKRNNKQKNNREKLRSSLNVLKNLKSINSFKDSQKVVSPRVLTFSSIFSVVDNVKQQNQLSINNIQVLPLISGKGQKLNNLTVAFIGYSRQLLLNNNYIIRNIHPFICFKSLKGFSTTAGFKKILYNRVNMQERKLKPGYNRRKHNHSHYIIITNQLRRLDKTFNYIGKNKLVSIIAFVLKVAYCLNKRKNQNNFVFNTRLSPNIRAIPNLVSIIEAQKKLLLWRNQLQYHFTISQNQKKHRGVKNVNLFCKNNTVIIYKK